MAQRRPRLPEIRAAMRAAILADESRAVHACVDAAGLTRSDRASIVARAVELVRTTRARAGASIMQGFLAEYGLSTREGVALMCLAEALLRVPDTETIDALIEDKIGASDWAAHLGHSSSPLVNASTWALLLTGKVLGEAEEGLGGALHEAIRRLGEPVIRAAVAQAMRELGHQFVLGRDMREAATRAAAMEARGCTYSYDMLGEAARTEADARRYHLAYSASIAALAGVGRGAGVRDRPGVSVKLSALHARYEFAQHDRVMSELVARLRSLALLAQSAGIGLNVDAEEADRLDLSLDVVEAVLAGPALAGWEGFGVVVQAYGKRALHVVDWLHELARQLGRRIMVRLVKGAYWDTEIKRAQVLGLDGFPVFTRKGGTDVSFLACARRLLAMTDRIYPQFATHNAHTMAAALHMAGDRKDFEFQRLHGMGEALHEAVREAHGTRCRIYAPVGAHHDLLAYLVRRLLENGANSSFVNQIVDESVTPEEIARDPVEVMERLGAAAANPRIAAPPDVEAALDAARSGAAAWASTNVEDRAARVRRVADLYEAHAAELFELATREAGKTWPDAVGEVREACDFARFYASEALREASGGRRFPRGVIACISPWNFPLAIFSGQILAALCGHAEAEGRVLKRLAAPDGGRFVPPTVLRVDGIEALGEEIFGPVLHVATFDADRIDAVVDAVNAAGYGLTFGLHTRIDDRVQHVVDRVRAGNIYVNRNQIGAVVGSQPFGGEGLSGTGPKAGGPHYVRRLTAGAAVAGGVPGGEVVDVSRLAAAVTEAARGLAAWSRRGWRLRPPGGHTGGSRLSSLDLPGPTGESNRLSFAPRGVVLCLGPGAAVARAQLTTALHTVNAVVVVVEGAKAALGWLLPDPRVVLLDGQVAPDALAAVNGIAAVACNASRETLAAMRVALARRPGPIVPLITERDAPERYVLERHVCVDTTAAGGNASLLADAEA